jgi:hypothetical protein
LLVIASLLFASTACTPSPPPPANANAAARTGAAPSASTDGISAVPVSAVASPSASVASAHAAPDPSAPNADPTAIGAPLAESRVPNCDVVVEQLLDAHVYRGSPSSPMKWQSYRNNPSYARFAEGIDHGAEYLSCVWRLRVNGAYYRYERASHGGPMGADGELAPEQCSEPTEASDTAKSVVAFTDGCKDLHRGEYYGDVLQPQTSR